MDSGSSSGQQGRKRSRENTVEEKRAMNKTRKKRKHRMKVEDLRAECDKQKKLKASAEISRVKYTGMSRTYWERWQWELRAGQSFQSTAADKIVLPNIDPSMLEEPLVDGERRDCYAGRGSFGIVRLCLFRNIEVAVKEFLPKTLREDVMKEAHILSSICHPYLPCILGVCLKDTPLRIVMQSHTTNCKSITLFQELHYKKLHSTDLVFRFCAQLMEALHYLHSEVEILHNDITK